VSVLDLLDQSAIHLPSSASTLDGFRAWITSGSHPDNVRVSFVNEEIVIDMSPEELESHNKVKAEISRVISGLIRELDLGTFYSDGTLLSSPAANLSTEPDALFVQWESFQTSRIRPVPRQAHPGEHVELEGAPDWVLEVVSRSSVRKDTQLLRQAYHAADVPEFWLVNAFGPEIEFQILVREADEYRPMPSNDRWIASPIFGREFRLSRDFDRLGYRRYSLEVR
jgi:Uma2 family endonuclease